MHTVTILANFLNVTNNWFILGSCNKLLWYRFCLWIFLVCCTIIFCPSRIMTSRAFFFSPDSFVGHSPHVSSMQLSFLQTLSWLAIILKERKRWNVPSRLTWPFFSGSSSERSRSRKLGTSSMPVVSFEPGKITIGLHCHMKTDVKL